MDRHQNRAMQDLIAEFQMIPPGSRVLCAISGGADSIYLLYQLYQMSGVQNLTLAAAHYNHKLRGEESDRDEAFVRSFVSTWCGGTAPSSESDQRELQPVKLVVSGGDVLAEARRRKTGIEETARDLRYTFLEETARMLGCDRIATAHNAHDNVETLLLNLTRGAGLRGLTGIPPVRGPFIRPMLTTSREAIDAYLTQFALPHMEDSSNLDSVYRRNQVRHEIIPALQALNPRLVPRITDTIALLRADEAYLQSIADRTLAEQAILRGNTLYLPAAVAAQPDPIATRVIRGALERLGVYRCSAAHLISVLSICRGEDPSAQVSLPAGMTARREYEMLVFTREPSTPISEACPLPLPGRREFHGFSVTAVSDIYAGQQQTPWNFWLSQEKVRGGICLRSRQTGDALRLEKRGNRTVKKQLIDKKIPRDRRTLLPVLDCGGIVASVAGLGPDMAFLPVTGERAFHITIEKKTTERKKSTC